MSRAVAVREWAQRSAVGVATFQPSMFAKLGGAVERVTGIGGVFFRSSEPERLAAWYAQHLGLNCSPQGDVVWQQEAGPTVWAPFPQDSDHLGRPERGQGLDPCRGSLGRSPPPLHSTPAGVCHRKSPRWAVAHSAKDRAGRLVTCSTVGSTAIA